LIVLLHIYLIGCDLCQYSTNSGVNLVYSKE
jgi:hypothetical protein